MRVSALNQSFEVGFNESGSGHGYGFSILSESGYGSRDPNESGSNPDPDPHNCFKPKRKFIGGEVFVIPCTRNYKSRHL
jgi:hypothetical protein